MSNIKNLNFNERPESVNSTAPPSYEPFPPIREPNYYLLILKKNLIFIVIAFLVVLAGIVTLTVTLTINKSGNSQDEKTTQPDGITTTTSTEELTTSTEDSTTTKPEGSSTPITSTISFLSSTTEEKETTKTGETTISLTSSTLSLTEDFTTDLTSTSGNLHSTTDEEQTTELTSTQVSTTVGDDRLKWQSWNYSVKAVPSGAFVGGRTPTRTYFVIRGLHANGILPGKYSPEDDFAYVSFDGREIEIRNFEILIATDDELTWEIPDTGRKLVAGGISADGEVLHICRFDVLLALVPGKIHNNLCYVPHGGREHSSTDWATLKFRYN